MLYAFVSILYYFAMLTIDWSLLDQFGVLRVFVAGICTGFWLHLTFITLINWLKKNQDK